jgi:peptide/nickel transport system permease protein
MSKAGQISFPVLTYLSTEDLAVLAAFFTILLLWWLPLKLKFRVNLALLAAVLAGVVVLANVYLKPPQLVIYDDFRSANYTEVDWRIMPPIPYAPQDYLRDYGDTGLEPPLANKAADDKRLHLMGTEENGADVLSRMIHASRIALSIGIVATSISMLLGIIIGGFMGYFSGVVDMIGMRLVEIFEAIPTLFLLLTFVAFFGRSLYMMMIIIGVTSWSGYARYIRAEFLKLRRQDYVQAAVAAGLPLPSILFRHMLPNGVAPLLVAASFGVASAILAEATLSFLGLGLVEEPSWGQMLDQSVTSASFNWWMAVFPGGAIFLTVFAYTLIGEAFRDAIDPNLSREAGVQ